MKTVKFVNSKILRLMVVWVAMAMVNSVCEAGGDTEMSVDLGSGVTMEFVLIRPSSFIMGEGEEKHRVTITKPFYMGKYEVTQKQWQAVMGGNCRKGPRNPIDSVSWDDCQSFMAKLNEKQPSLKASLPTEAQWEYACKAGSATRYYYGDDESSLANYAWFNLNSGSDTHPVGAKRPNAWGLYDMYGNVEEWCSDLYDHYPTYDQEDPQGPTFNRYGNTNRVLRGGSWFTGANLIGTSKRGISGRYRDNTFGFRVVLAVATSAHSDPRGTAGRGEVPDNHMRHRESETVVSMGTGWLTTHGYVVTCYHVVRGHSRLFIKSGKLEKLPVKLVQKDIANDLAVLQPDKLEGLPSGLPLSDADINLAQKVFTLGYPQIELLGNALKFSEGAVSARSGMDDDPRFLQVSVPVQAGNSGGPLINSSGEVVGVMVAKLAAVRVFMLTGDLPQNVNYAVKAAYVKPLFSSLDKREFSVLQPRKMETEELVLRLSDSVLMVIAE